MRMNNDIPDLNIMSQKYIDEINQTIEELTVLKTDQEEENERIEKLQFCCIP